MTHEHKFSDEAFIARAIGLSTEAGIRESIPITVATNMTSDELQGYVEGSRFDSIIAKYGYCRTTTHGVPQIDGAERVVSRGTVLIKPVSDPAQ